MKRSKVLSVRSLGRYQLLRHLARGGMADLYLARQRSTGGVEKRLVIKTIRSERAHDARFHQRFIDEARLSMSLSHKNIVSVFDFGRIDDELFLAMEYVEGRDLGDALAQARKHRRPIDPVVAAFIGIEAAQAVAYAQTTSDERGRSRPIVHRDISPKNVMLSFAGEVRLLDFGVAVSQTSVGGGQPLVGTLGYMAPEQARGEPVDVRSDLYSLGVVLWEALAGMRMRKGADKQEMVTAARTGITEPLPDFVPHLLRTVVSKAVDSETENRWQTPHQLQLALDQYIVSARTTDEGGPPIDRLATWLTELFPERNERILDAGETPQRAEVVSFLGDGLDALAVPDQRTQRSIAETVAEGDTKLETTGGRWRTVGAVTAVALLVSFGITMIARPRGEEREAGAVDANVFKTDPLSTDSLSTDSLSTDSLSTDPQPVASASLFASSGISVMRDASPSSLAVDSAPALVPAPVPARAEPSPRAVPELPALGALVIGTKPWARVIVVGNKRGCRETPCRLRLPAGRYTLVLSNPVVGVTKRLKVRVKAGETTKVTARLRNEGSTGP